MNANVTKQTFRQKYIGDRAFYKMVLAVVIPIIIQNGISNFVNMLDNIMIGSVGTEQMSGVSIANQLMFIYMLCMFGGLSGIGIFSAQYYGNQDMKGLRYSFRAKLWLVSILTVIAVIVMLTAGEPILRTYLNEDNEAAEATLRYGLQYMHIMMLSFPAMLLTNAYASTLRECGQTVIPMRAGVTSVFVNLVFNYLLIFGKFGFPEMGVAGAAVATVIARYVEASVILFWTHSHRKENEWIVGAYRSLRVPKEHLINYVKRGTPLLLNETLWSTGMALLTQCYSTRGLNVIAAFNIANTINNICNIVFIAMGSAVGIIIGQLLGAGRLEEAHDQDRKLIAFSITFSLITTFSMLIFSGIFPKAYNTNEEARAIASVLIILYGVFAPQNAFCHAAYFTMRSGGKTFVTFLFDSVFTWVVSVPIAWGLSRYTSLSAPWIFVFVSAGDLIKCIVGYILLKKGIWINNIIGEKEA